MFDTSVLSYLAMQEPPRAGTNKKQERDHDEWMAARQAAVRAHQVVVSSVTWFELQGATIKSTGKTFADAVAGAVPNLDILELDAPAADLAASMLRKARGWESCPKCLVWVDDKPCRGCKRVVPQAFKTHDALIVAHANCVAEVDLLLTFDGGMVELGKLAPRKSLKVTLPEHPHGMLWAHAQAAQPRSSK